MVEHSKTFLQFLDRMNLVLGASVKIIEKFDYDGSIRLTINDTVEQVISNKVAQNIYVKY